MDKLKPVLAHSFWIVFGAALLVPLVGWWMATGATAEGIDKRWTELEGKKPASTATEPNETWIVGAQGVVAVKQQLLKASGEELWEQQNAKRLWPATMTRDLAGVEPGGEIPPRAREYYRNHYFYELERIIASVDPIYPPEGFQHQSKRLVMVTEDEIDHVDREDYRSRLPGSQEMWEAQEDLWLIESLLKAVANVNEGATNAGEASIMAIEQVSLHGGMRQAAGDAATATPAAGGHGSGGYSAAMASANMGGRSRQTSMGTVSIEVNPVDVFGPDTVGAAGGEGGSPGGGHGSQGSMPAGVTGPGGQEKRRYVDDDPTAPFKTRGFILKVVMDHTKVPHLLSELAQLDWPVQILVVNQQANNESLMTGESTGGGSSTRMYGGSRPSGHGSGPTTRPTGRARFQGSPSGGHGSPAGGYQVPSRSRSPMGSRSPGSQGAGGYGRGSGSRGSTGSGTQVQDEAGEKAEILHAQAVDDASVATVVIAGLMTIYQPPQLSVGQQLGQAAQAPVEPTTVDGTQPATDPAATDPAAEPMPPASATDIPTTEPVPPPSGEAPAATDPAPTDPASPAPEGQAPAAPAEGTEPPTDDAAPQPQPPQ